MRTNAGRFLWWILFHPPINPGRVTSGPLILDKQNQGLTYLLSLLAKRKTNTNTFRALARMVKNQATKSFKFAKESCSSPQGSVWDQKRSPKVRPCRHKGGESAHNGSLQSSSMEEAEAAGLRPKSRRANSNTTAFSALSSACWVHWRFSHSATRWQKEMWESPNTNRKMMLNTEREWAYKGSLVQGKDPNRSALLPQPTCLLSRKQSTVSGSFNEYNGVVGGTLKPSKLLEPLYQ